MRLLPLLALPFLLTAAAPEEPNDRGPGLPGERQGGTMTYRASDFDHVRFGLAGDVDVRVGPLWSVRATGPAAAFADLRIVREDGMLEIGHRYRDKPVDRELERQVHFVVTLPHVAKVGLGGSGRMTVDRVRGGAFDAMVGGSGRLTLGVVEVDRATIAIGGSGGVTARGSARSLSVKVGGSGSLEAAGLRADDAQVATAGSGSVRASVDGPARIMTVGNGYVDLGPKARCTVTRIGKTQVRCGS